MATNSGRRGRPRKNATDPLRQDDNHATDPPMQHDDRWIEMMQRMLDQTIATNNLLKLLTQAAVPNQPPPPHYEDPNRAFFQFYKLNPPTFSGGTDVMAALHWLDSMEKIFMVVKCTEEQKVTFATHMLNEASDNWWWGEKARFSAKGTPLDWENFQSAFLDRYFPITIRVKKLEEFVLLRQGGLSVEEYLTKFEELDRYASHAKYTMDETWKINRFQRGLRDDITTNWAHLTFPRFDTLVNQSYESEECLKNMEEEREQEWLKNKNEGKHSRHLKVRVAPNKGKHVQSFNYFRVVECPKCGKMHGGECLAGQNVCFTCGQPGHTSPYCPLKK